jgi:hypothetical protein
MSKILLVVLVTLVSLPARAQNAQLNPLAGVPLHKYEVNREKQDDPVLAGRRFLADLEVVSPAVQASVVDAVRSQIQAEETARFARQNKFVLWAYGAAWAIVAALVGALLFRQRRLAAELADLEARVKIEKP